MTSPYCTNIKSLDDMVGRVTKRYPWITQRELYAAFLGVLSVEVYSAHWHAALALVERCIDEREREEVKGDGNGTNDTL